MAKTDFKSVDEYIGTQPETVQAVLERVRGIIRKAVPDAEEVISYQIPAYKLHGAPVLYFAGWKQHYSLYPVTDELVAAFEDDLAPYEVNKGTIRFPLSQPIPVKLIERIAKFRAKETTERAKAKAVAKKTVAKKPTQKKKQSEPQETALPSGLSKPAQRALAGAGYVRLEQFTRLREADVLKLHGMGPKAMDLLRRALKAQGLSFADGKTRPKLNR